MMKMVKPAKAFKYRWFLSNAFCNFHDSNRQAKVRAVVESAQVSNKFEGKIELSIQCIAA